MDAASLLGGRVVVGGAPVAAPGSTSVFVCAEGGAELSDVAMKVTEPTRTATAPRTVHDHHTR